MRSKLSGLIGFVFVGLGLYLWLEILGGVARGLAILAVLLGFVLVASLPAEPVWCKVTKIIVLAVGVIWAISDMLPIQTAGAWVLSIFIGAAFCLFGYIILFDDFLR